MENHTAQKRQRAPSDADIVSEAGNCAKRAQRPFSQPAFTVGHATATGSARMLNGHVHGHNIHGNVSTTINNFHAGVHESSNLPGGPETSGILSESERKDLLERLRFPQIDARLTNLRKAESRTCDWIMQRKDYIEWLRSDDLKACNGFFWIKGNPGTGKSITMKFLYQRMQRQLRDVKSKDKLVISFFFNARGNKFEKSTLGLYRSLLFNLLTLEPNLHEAFDHCQRGGYHNILESDWQLQMLKEVFEEAVTLLQAQGKKLYCFVDALDECPEDDVQDMVSYFEDLAGKTDSRHFRICFSSRHYPQISIRTKLTMVLEKERNHNEDIRIFIKSQLRFDEDVDAELLRQIRAEILEKSSGIFLWVNLVVHQLNEVQRQDGRMKAVQRRLREIPEAAKQRPAPNGAMPLYGLFDDIIQKDQRNIDKLVQITQVVFCARWPLHPKELYILLHQEYDAPFDASEISDKVLTKHVLEVSKGLAEVTKSENPTVQFIHETVREFLRDGGLKNICTHAQSIDRDGHELLKSSCLKQIHAPVSGHLELLAEYERRGQYRNTKVHETTMSQQQEFQQQANAKFPFLEYASKNVLFHADEAESIGVSQIEFLESFPTAEWIRIYNLFQIYNRRRYSGATTPILYILAEHGCNHLIKSSARFRGQYARNATGEVFPSALACAIYSGNLDTAWTLVGLDARSRPQNIVAPPRSNPKPSLMSILLKLGDVSLMRKVVEDGHAFLNSTMTHVDFELVSSAEMIDLLLEFLIVPGFPSVGNPHDNPRGDQEPSDPPRPNANLIFIRRAISIEPSLLISKTWGGRTMLDYAIGQNLQPLVSLHLEFGGQHNLDAVLHHYAARADLHKVKQAHRYGANLGFQDENGCTALHLAAEYRTVFQDQHERTLLYLLSKEPSCVNVRDGQGRTALAIGAAHGFLVEHTSDLLVTFLHAGADPNTAIKCHECDNHELPLLVLMALRGNVHRSLTLVFDYQCDLNGRDSFGKTALSWCFAHQRNIELFGHNNGHIHESSAGYLGEQLLQQPAVDVNSRDNSGYTILEDFIRYASPFEHNRGPEFRSFVHKFFQSDRLDPNLRTSNQQFPLELIVSLYDTELDEFGRLGSHLVVLAIFEQGSSQETQQAFNQHLIQALRLLLGTGRVDIDVQRRCACAEETAPELRRIILGSIQSIS